MPSCARFLLLIVLGLCPCAFLRAQMEIPPLPEPTSQFYVFVSPLKTIDRVNPGALYGIGMKWPTGYAVELGHLYLFENIPWADRVEDNRGHRVHLGLRLYFKPEEPDDAPAPYAQLRTDYLRRSHRAVASFQSPDDSTALFFPPAYRDSIGVETTTLTFNGMLGMEFPFGPFLIDASIGLGWRWRHVRHTDRIREEDRHAPETNVEEWFTRNDPAREATVNIPLDIRLIYRW